jgi:[ribosomal protein S5]-alanine N-acetyltransferase
MSIGRRSIPMGHPSQPPAGGVRLYGRRVMIRPLAPADFTAWSEVRIHNESWLLPWEPLRSAHHPDPTVDRDAFASRCMARDRDRQIGTGCAFGLFVNDSVAGEINLNNIVRGAQQSGTIGYWVDRRKAGNAYVAEAVVILAKFAFDELRLHRLEICIVPRNDNSRRVMDKLRIREEGIAQRFVEINGVWEDHVRYGLTTEEFAQRRQELTNNWLS